MFLTLGAAPMRLPAAAEALPGRTQPLPLTNRHFVTGRPLKPPFPPGLERLILGMGCFWGAERTFWLLDGVYTTAVGYAAGHTPNPTYREVCSGRTGHNEATLVVYDPARLSCRRLLQTFWENHDPTQGMRQGNDAGTQYRSGIYVFDAAQRRLAQETQQQYQAALTAAGYGAVTTEVRDAPEFYYAEDYHQQYLAKNPGGYCGLGGTGVALAAAAGAAP